MPCSAVTLSLATITGIIATALLAIAFATDNWLYTEVKRAQIQQQTSKTNRVDKDSVVNDLNSRYYYYTRTQGLFRICYPKERPPNYEIYLSPVETYCMNIDYHFRDSDTDTEVKSFSEDAMARLHMGRSVIGLFAIAFVAIFIAFLTGFVGCWRRSPANVTATAILMLFACLLSAGGMGLWHGVEYYEKEKMVGEEYYHQWDSILRENTLQTYDWSFYLAWVGVASCLVSMTLFLIGGSLMRKESSRDQQMQNSQFMIPIQTIYPPVYPQKQQYAYTTAGYPGPTAAYPGPYYHGSQGYPYNY